MRVPDSVTGDVNAGESSAKLLVDLGKTTCRIAVVKSGIVVQAYESVGNLGLAGPGGVESVIRIITEARWDEGCIEAISVGAPGALSAPVEASVLAHRLKEELGCNVAVTSDAVMGHLGALGGAWGVVLTAGTGAVAVGIGEGGDCLTVDGAGPEIGDLGSGSWIGRQAASRILRVFQCANKTGLLFELVRNHVGSMSELPMWSLGSPESKPARRLAQLAPLVFQAARAGDVLARAIVAEAVQHLSRTVRVAVQGIGSEQHEKVPVTIVGGMTGDELFAQELFSSLESEEIRIVKPVGGPQQGALLALTNDLPHHEGLIHRA